MPLEILTTTQFPYEAVAFLVVTFPDGSRIQGTGTVVGRNDILTATHMVYDPSAGGWATDVDVYPGADYNAQLDRFDARPLAYEDVGFRLEAFADRVHADGNDDSLTFAESAYDVAVIGLDVAIGDVTGWFGIDTGTDAATVAYSLGYPSTGSGLMLARPRIDREAGFSVYSTYGGQELMGPGSSGGPLYVLRDDQPYLIGVKSSGTTGVSNHWADIGLSYESLILPAMARNDALLTGSPGGGTALPNSAGTASPGSQQDGDDGTSAVIHAAIYRYARLPGGSYFYTASDDERQAIAASHPDLRFEGPVFYGASQADAGLMPVYRYANLLNGGYFYTTSEAERASIATGHPELRFEGAVFQVPDTSDAGDIAPVYRLASLSGGGYLFTQSAGERSFALSLGDWRDEGIAFLAWRGDPAQTADTVDAPLEPRPAEPSANLDPEWLL